MIVEGLSGERVADQVFEAIKARLAEEAEKIPAAQGMVLVKLAENLLQNLVGATSVLYGRGLLPKLDLAQPIIPLCWQAAALLEAKDLPFDGEVFAAQRVFTSAAELVAFILVPPKEAADLLKAAMAFGAADVILTHAVSGIWGMMADAATNAETAESLAKGRNKGGAKQAEHNKKLAQAWKDKVLPYAIMLDKKFPKGSRSLIAWEIKDHFKKTIPNGKSIEVWLQKEAEQPNGPLRYRGRTKAAETKSAQLTSH